jgi:hypothetical protein
MPFLIRHSDQQNSPNADVILRSVPVSGSSAKAPASNGGEHLDIVEQGSLGRGRITGGEAALVCPLLLAAGEQPSRRNP